MRRRPSPPDPRPDPRLVKLIIDRTQRAMDAYVKGPDAFHQEFHDTFRSPQPSTTPAKTAEGRKAQPKV